LVARQLFSRGWRRRSCPVHSAAARRLPLPPAARPTAPPVELVAGLPTVLPLFSSRRRSFPFGYTYDTSSHLIIFDSKRRTNPVYPRLTPLLWSSACDRRLPPRG